MSTRTSHGSRNDPAVGIESEVCAFGISASIAHEFLAEHAALEPTVLVQLKLFVKKSAFAGNILDARVVAEKILFE